MGWERERGQGQARLCQGSTRAKFGSSSTAPAGTVSQRAGSCPHTATTAMGTEGSVPHCGDRPAEPGGNPHLNLVAFGGPGEQPLPEAATSPPSSADDSGRLAASSTLLKK